MKKNYWVLIDKQGNIDHEVGGRPLIFSSKRKAFVEKKDGGKYYRNINPCKCEIRLLN